MFKKSIFFTVIILLTFFFQKVLSEESICKIIKNMSNHEYYSLPKLIEINVNNSQKWNINGRRLILDLQKQNPQYTPGGLGKIKTKYKKKFRAKIKVIFEDGNVCTFMGNVKQHGDIMDHIKLLDDGNLSQSIGVSLDSGNINGVTKFYLFLNGTRNSSDEIFFTQLLRNLKYLAPKTYMMKTNINGIKSAMLFQEKIGKEFLESMKRREGPIFEGDEAFRWTFKYEDHLIFAKTELAKQTNTTWAQKSDIHKDISNLSLTKINQFYLSNNLTEIKNVKKINFPVVNLDTSYLSGDNIEQNKNLNKFNIMHIAANGLHGLVNNNRKFYWNSIFNFFEAIYYDGDLEIGELKLKNINYNIYNYPDQNSVGQYIEELKDDIERINFDSFYEDLKKLDNRITKTLVFKWKDQILKNLDSLKINYLNLSQNVSIVKNIKRKLTVEIFKNYLNLLKSKDLSNRFLIFKNDDNNKLYKCGLAEAVYKCTHFVLSEKNEINMLKGPLPLGKKIYHYIGSYKGLDETNYQDFIYTGDKVILNKVKILNSTFYYDESINYNWDSEKLTLDIIQNKNNARAYFVGGQLKDININFQGAASKKNKSFQFYPFDRRGLTGCLSFINVTFSKASINSSATNCEDSLNIINSSGQINQIRVNETFLDALDIDFSNLNIKKIIINNAGNDCLDVSYGEYYFQSLLLENCGDKGFSIGEKSLVNTDSINIKNSNIAVASKDSSTTNLNNLLIENVKTCLAAYKKKQEFFGSLVRVKNMECENYFNKTDIDQYSSISINNQL